MKRYTFTDSPQSFNETVLTTVYVQRYGDTPSFLRHAHIVIVANVVHQWITRYLYFFDNRQLCDNNVVKKW